MPIWYLVKHGSAEPSSLDQWSTKEALRSSERTLQSRDGAPQSITEYLSATEHNEQPQNNSDKMQY